MKKYTCIIKEQEDWEKLSKYILNNYSEQHIILLYGNLGAGKTTFVQAFAKILKTKEHITSPTFSIMHEYHYNNPPGKIYHFDLYRIKNVQELKDIGFEDYLYSGNYCFIEWPDIAESIFKEHEDLQDKTLTIQIHCNENSQTRNVEVIIKKINDKNKINS